MHAHALLWFTPHARQCLYRKFLFIAVFLFACGQLDSLMETLNSTRPHYVRCIKPNEVKRYDFFDANSCLQQLRYAGVFQAVTIRQRGFPFRWPHEQFFKRCAGSRRRCVRRVCVPLPLLCFGLLGVYGFSGHVLQQLCVVTVHAYIRCSLVQCDRCRYRCCGEGAALFGRNIPADASYLTLSQKVKRKPHLLS